MQDRPCPLVAHDRPPPNWSQLAIPLAAAWEYRRRAAGSGLLLIGDFGGGTTDFSLIQVAEEGGELTLEQALAEV